MFAKSTREKANLHEYEVKNINLTELLSDSSEIKQVV